MRSGGWFNIKMPSYEYRKSHCGDKTILRPSYLKKMGFPVQVRWYLYIESGPCSAKTITVHNPNLHSILPWLLGQHDCGVFGWCMAVLSPEVTFHIHLRIRYYCNPNHLVSSTLELFWKAMVNIWIKLYLIQFHFLTILYVFVSLVLKEFLSIGVKACPY